MGNTEEIKENLLLKRDNTIPKTIYFRRAYETSKIYTLSAHNIGANSF